MFYPTCCGVIIKPSFAQNQAKYYIFDNGFEGLKSTTRCTDVEKIIIFLTIYPTQIFIIFFYLYWIRHFGACILYFAQLWNWQEYIHICNGCRPALPPTQYQDCSFNTPLMHILVQLLLPRSKIVIYCRHYVGIYNIHTVLTRYQRAWPWS